MDLYSEEFFEHGKFPRNVGKFAKPDYYREEINTSCGDNIKVYIKEGKIRYEVTGCMVTTASASMVSEKSPEEIAKMTPEDLLELLKIKLTPGRMPCAMLPLVAIQKALNKKQETRNKKQR